MITKTSVLYLLVALSLVLSGCVAGKYKPVDNMAGLEVTLADPLWSGKDLPPGQQCNKFGGTNPATPSLRVENIPANTNALILEFSDAQYQPMDFGGHGKVGYTLTSSSDQVTVPSLPGHTFDLPAGFFLVAAHQNPSWDTAGAYMPPCSGGKGHRYYVTVKAVHDAPEGQESQLLGKGELTIGYY